MGFGTYFYRVYIPKFNADAVLFSFYSPESERKMQVRLWISFTGFVIALMYHVWTLIYCHYNHRKTVCYMNMYSWGVYGAFLAVACLHAMLLHYGYTESNKKGKDYDSEEQYDLETESESDDGETDVHLSSGDEYEK